MKRGQYDYYERLKRQGALALEAAQTLEKALAGYDFLALPEQTARLHSALQESAEIRSKLTEAVIEDFLPPRGREDIMGMSAGLEGIVLNAGRALENLYALQLSGVPALLGHLARRIAAQAALAAETADMLAKLKKSSGDVLQRVVRMGELSRETDGAYAEALQALFTQGEQSRAYAARALLLQTLRSCGDACAAFAAAVEVAVVKNQ